jgi:ABC-type nitrate/sulfonate/bicarbonate transport system substrate-binding protein
MRWSGRSTYKAVVALAAASMAFAGCGGSDSDGGSSTAAAGGGRGEVPSLKASVGSVGANYGPFYVAEAMGLFERHGVDVDVVTYTGTPTAGAMLVSGEVDLAVTNTTTGVAAMRQQPVIDLMNLYYADQYNLAVLGAEGVESIEDLRAKGKDCRMATGPAGTSIYGWTLQFQEAFGLECRLMEIAQAPAIAATVASGAADAATALPPDAATMTASRQGVTYIYDPLTAPEEIGRQIVPTPVPITGVFGMKDNVAEKREAVVRALAAMREGLLLIDRMEPEEFAQTLARNRAWAGVPIESIEAGAETTMKSLAGEQEGQITRPEWDEALAQMKLWDVSGIDPEDPNIQFDKGVDLTYLDEAAAQK